LLYIWPESSAEKNCKISRKIMYATIVEIIKFFLMFLLGHHIRSDTELPLLQLAGKSLVCLLVGLVDNLGFIL